jgi:hypothetical protein
MKLNQPENEEILKSIKSLQDDCKGSRAVLKEFPDGPMTEYYKERLQKAYKQIRQLRLLLTKTKPLIILSQQQISQLVKCKHCGKPKGEHLANGLKCPLGSKHRILSYTSYHKTKHFEPAIKKNKLK